MKTSSLRILGTALFLPLVCGSLFAGTTGSLEGTVRDKANGQPLIGATMLVVGTQTGAATDAEGRYVIGNIPAGRYDVRCTFVGYQTVIMKDVQIVADLKTKLDVDLSVSQVEMGAVEIVAERPAIQKDVTGTMHTATERSFQVLPVNTVAEIIALQPGVTQENNIRGGKTTEVVYLVDGLPVQNLIEGGSGSTLPQSSIGELTIQTGGFDPEYGNALSGVINMVTRRGGERDTFAVRAEYDDIFAFQQTDHRKELDLSASGPVAPHLHYFASLDGVQSDTRWWQDMSRFFSSPIEQTYDGFAKMDYEPNASMRISGQILYSYKQTRDYEYSWRFNLGGLPARKQEAYRGALIFSHTVSQSFFYTASISRYALFSDIGEGPKSSVDTTLYQWNFFLQYVVAGSRSWWARKDQYNNLGKVDATWRVNEHHMVRLGAELNLQEIQSDLVRYEPFVNIFGKPFINKPLLNYSTDYRYFPRTGSAYLQDKIELSRDGMLLNLGVRYEFLDPRAVRPLVERVPLQNQEIQTNVVGSAPATVKNLVSPRIGFAAPFAESGYLFINYGKYYQFPLFDYLYSGLNNVSLKKGVGALVGNPDLKPEATRSWEMSIKYALKNGVVLSSTYFHKETENLIDVKTFVPTNARIAGGYGFAEFVNNPFATASGIELMVTKDEGKTLTGSISYTYMTAEGVSQDAQSGLQYYEWGLAVPARPFPLSWDQRHTVKLIANLALPLDVGLSAIWEYHTGRPYTFFPSKDGFTPADTTMVFEPNNARMDDYNLLNVKIARVFMIGSGSVNWIRIQLYVDMRNVLNKKNIRWVDSSGRIGGELNDLTAWDTGRRVRLGARMEF